MGTFQLIKLARAFSKNCLLFCFFLDKFLLPSMPPFSLSFFFFCHRRFIKYSHHAESVADNSKSYCYLGRDSETEFTCLWTPYFSCKRIVHNNPICRGISLFRSEHNFNLSQSPSLISAASHFLNRAKLDCSPFACVVLKQPCYQYRRLNGSLLVI